MAIGMGAEAPNPIGAMLAQGNQPTQGPDGGDGALQALGSQVRQVGELVQQIGASRPEAAEEVQQIVQLLKSIVVKVAGTLQSQTASGAAVPGGGSF